MTARTEQAGLDLDIKQYNHDSIVRTKLPERAARPGLPRQESQNRTARTGLQTGVPR
jgi:hypothetical protein